MNLFTKSLFILLLVLTITKQFQQRHTSQTLRKIAPTLINKKVSQVISLLDLKKQHAIMFEEPPGICRGFVYQISENTTVRFLTERFSSVLLKQDRSKEEIKNFDKIDFDNLIKNDVIGIKWYTADSIFYVGKGFTWDHYLHIDSDREIQQVKGVKKKGRN